MKIGASVLLLISVMCFGGCASSAKKPMSLEEGTTRAFDVANSADWRVDYRRDKKFDIGIGLHRDGIWYANAFDFEELEPFLKKLRHKGHVAIMVEKMAWSSDEQAGECLKLKSCFLKVGFGRVTIIVCGGRGVGIVLDECAP